jgi:hypothetical protein
LIIRNILVCTAKEISGGMAFSFAWFPVPTRARVWKRGLYPGSLQGTGCPRHNFGDKVCTRSIPSNTKSQPVYSEHLWTMYASMISMMYDMNW